MSTQSFADQQPALKAGHVDQVVKVDFNPTAIKFLWETKKGQVNINAAQVSSKSFPLFEHYTNNEYLVGSTITDRKSVQVIDPFHFTFLLSGDQSGFASSPVKSWSLATLSQNSRPLEFFSSEVRELKSTLLSKQQDEVSLLEELLKIEEKLQKEIDLQSLINGKLRIMRLQKALAQKESDKLRLKTLVQRGRAIKGDSEIESHRQELSIHLREIANATALADRMAKQKHQASVNMLQNKLKLIREAEHFNAEQLARQVLRLRAERKSLEAEMQIAPTAQDEF